MAVESLLFRHSWPHVLENESEDLCSDVRRLGTFRDLCVRARCPLCRNKTTKPLIKQHWGCGQGAAANCLRFHFSLARGGVGRGLLGDRGGAHLKVLVMSVNLAHFEGCEKKHHRAIRWCRDARWRAVVCC